MNIYNIEETALEEELIPTMADKIWPEQYESYLGDGVYSDYHCG
jgi:hypothetical protein